mmetsp:Transcript_8388/g.18968  ORF Transcript_8388/g.18968 Transcript_8388/m.18968 type:complete len:337 (+) Transcript_8388:2266-3276(+)
MQNLYQRCISHRHQLNQQRPMRLRMAIRADRRSASARVSLGRRMTYSSKSECLKRISSKKMYFRIPPAKRLTLVGARHLRVAIVRSPPNGVRQRKRIEDDLMKCELRQVGARRRTYPFQSRLQKVGLARCSSFPTVLILKNATECFAAKQNSQVSSTSVPKTFQTLQAKRQTRMTNSIYRIRRRLRWSSKKKKCRLQFRIICTISRNNTRNLCTIKQRYQPSISTRWGSCSLKCKVAPQVSSSSSSSNNRTHSSMPVNLYSIQVRPCIYKARINRKHRRERQPPRSPEALRCPSKRPSSPMASSSAASVRTSIHQEDVIGATNVATYMKKASRLND